MEQEENKKRKNYQRRNTLTSPLSSLLLCFQKDDNLFVSSIPQHTRISNRSCSSSQPIDRYHMKLPENDRIYFSTESVHGLICFKESGESGNLIVWNPSRKQFLTLPKPRMRWSDREGVPFGSYYDECEVLTLGSTQESWRTVRTTYKYYAYKFTSGICIKGVIYYQRHDLVLVSFDVRSEKFGMRLLPSDIHYETLINYGGRLACLDKNNGRRLWILEDVEKDKWSHQDFLVPFGHHDLSLSIHFSLKGITQAGEFIYVPNAFHKSFYIWLFDPVRNSRRRLEFNRLADDEENGAQTRHMFKCLYAFPNHIESQMSL
ncbi:hypothetical protein EUTSA_v10003313mg [Eutrema salsugineum]|uniref:F-box associated beta-propeller type 3 domain-containing protein n=1 Tax=Eutrema salsugineum TaxID=72664 RepID=V4LXL3_EUTSA|nr:hypothetical protein EUTSA_v10003313mg [Eutrema salsugineum]